MLTSLRALNLGCGRAKIKGAVNVDCVDTVNPDLCFDITTPFPLKDEEFDEVYFFHCIEHIEKYKQGFVLSEIHRVLKPNGFLYISYPEFGEIVQRWLDRENNDRKFWEAAVYGRQSHKGDYHYSAMDSLELRELLFNAGFEVRKQFSEPTQPFNTVMHCERMQKLITYEELLYNEVFAR